MHAAAAAADYDITHRMHIHPWRYMAFIRLLVGACMMIYAQQQWGLIHAAMLNLCHRSLITLGRPANANAAVNERKHQICRTDARLGIFKHYGDAWTDCFPIQRHV